MAATDKVLGDLHNAVARALIRAIEGYTDKEGNPVYPTAAEMGAAITFLKNNNITCVATDDNALGELQRKLQEKQHGRTNPGKRLLEAALAEYKTDSMQ